MQTDHTAMLASLTGENGKKIMNVVFQDIPEDDYKMAALDRKKNSNYFELEFGQ